VALLAGKRDALSVGGGPIALNRTESVLRASQTDRFGAAEAGIQAPGPRNPSGWLAPRATPPEAGRHESIDWRFDLWSYADVSANSEVILERLSEGTMPCDRTWPDQDIEKFRQWVADGMSP
jgi:hypothetical protein